MSSQSDNVLALGKKLVGELDLDNGVDTLGRWMAHYISELIRDAENAPPEDKPSKQEKCAAAILHLWRHRAELPDGMRPFEDAEPIFRALESLDPCNRAPNYFSHLRIKAKEDNLDSETDNWLTIADTIDSTAKELIAHCLGRAAETVQDKTLEWVALAEKAGLEAGFDVQVLRFVIQEAELQNGEKLEDNNRQKIRAQIDRLDAFGKLAASLSDDIRRKLKE